MGKSRMSEAYNLDRNDEVRSHLWLQGLQETLAARLTEIMPPVPPEVTSEREKPEARASTTASASSAHVSLVERLKRRKVVQWLLGYVAVSWMLLQLNDVLADVWGVPLTLQRAGSLALGLGLLPALVLAWYHGEKGRQRVCCAELGLISATLGIALATVWRVCFG